jgi:hypothetical protein
LTPYRLSVILIPRQFMVIPFSVFVPVSFSV